MHSVALPVDDIHVKQCWGAVRAQPNPGNSTPSFVRHAPSRSLTSDVQAPPHT